MNIHKLMEGTKKYRKMMEEKLKSPEYNIPPQLKIFGRNTIRMLTKQELIYDKWVEYGEKTFILSSDLVEGFLNTDIPLDMKVEEFKFPFITFMIDSPVPMFSTMVGKNKYDISSIIVVCFGQTKEISKLPKFLKWMIRWDTTVYGLYESNIDGFNTLDSLHLDMKSDQGISKFSKSFKEQVGLYDLDNEDIQNLANMVFNTLLYINQPANAIDGCISTIRKPRGKKNGKKIMKEFITIDPPNWYRSISKRAKDGSGKKLDKRFIVRGHWRNQPYGKGRSMRRHIWIIPHWKGPEWGEVTPKKYKVE